MDINEQYYMEQATEEELNALNWGSIVNVSEQFIEKFKDRVNWNNLLFSRILSESLLDSCIDYIVSTNNFEYLIHKQIVSEQFIEKYIDKFSWSEWISVAAQQCLSEQFIEKYTNSIYWPRVASNQKLSEQFIETHKNVLPSRDISIFQKLSESFLERNSDYIDWFEISKYQPLSESFIEKYFHKLNKYSISKYQRLSKNFIKKYKDELVIHIIQDSWHYKSTEFKKQKIMETNLYECYDDYFIAYKGIRANRYSRFNFQYKYEKGGIYESWADASSEEASFGLSAWTENLAKDYCDELVIPVKVKYEDVARIVHNNGKIRCFKLEVLD